MGSHFVHIKLVKIWKFILKIKTVKQYGKTVKLILHALYSDLTVVCTLTVLCICQQRRGIRRRITVDRYCIACCVVYTCDPTYMWDHTVLPILIVIVD